MLTTSSVAATTVTGVMIAFLIARIGTPLALIVTTSAPVPVVGVTIIPVPASIDLGLFEYDIFISFS
jgi:hypothetical protein